MSKDSEAAYWLDQRHLEYHRRQFDAPYRSTVKMGEFVREVAPDTARIKKVADVGCGSGANIFHLSKVFPGLEWTGFDFNPAAMRLGEQVMAELGGVSGSVTFQEADFYKLSERVPSHSFDMVFFHQTLGFLERTDFEVLLKQFFFICKPGGWIFMSSLFTDFLVDAKIELRRYAEETLESAGLLAYYVVYCLPRFEQICRKLGGSQVVSKDFEMVVF